MTMTACPNPMCGCPSCGCEECRCGTATIGDLEGRVMDALWEHESAEATVKDIAQSFPDLAYTTVATMLDRLTEKGLARCRVENHIKQFSGNGSRAAYTAMAMYESLSKTSEAGAALGRFVQILGSKEREQLKEALEQFKRD
jgi:BlaI family transcriptional regulator, penicillinase repressor